MGGTVQGLDAFNDDAIGTMALNLRAHLNQQFGEIHDLGFAGGVFSNGLTLC